MKLIIIENMKIPLSFSLLIFLIINSSCNNHQRGSIKEKANQLVYHKPLSNYQDSLHIDVTAAVFYHPDSLQLLQFKKEMDSSVYDGTMHEFFYQIRNAKIVLQKSWPKIKIVDAKDCRFLIFQKIDGQNELIDLNQKNDAYGLFLFDQIKPPHLVDMTNIETALSMYFN